MVSGIFCIMFGLISAVGISQLQARRPAAAAMPHVLLEKPSPDGQVSAYQWLLRRRQAEPACMQCCPGALAVLRAVSICVRGRG